MIHSLVIGITLSITTGPEFSMYNQFRVLSLSMEFSSYTALASLVIAIVFHQLFEGLSLGIRIAGLPASDSERTSPLPLHIKCARPDLMTPPLPPHRRLSPLPRPHTQTAPRHHLRDHDAARDRPRAAHTRGLGQVRKVGRAPPHARAGHDVRGVGRDAHLRGVCGDARGRLCDGRALVAEQRQAAGARAREPVCGCGCDGRYRVSAVSRWT